ncbi:MAG TPA: cytochrome c [Pseudacidobacterium sp.]|jgi:mono/diheme cytochrome c family protein|nr:cytochrome c [Pseudacidobacterium sp.]
MTLKHITCICAVSLLTAGTMSFAQETAADIYKAKCQMCHAADGSGDTPTGKAMKVRSFSLPEVVKMSDEELFNITKNGKGKMPAYANKLTDDQIKALVAHIRTLQKK